MRDAQASLTDALPALSRRPAAALAFRPFFLAAALYAVAPVASWLRDALGRGAPEGLAPWHAEALLFGMIAAGMAGFMLTAMPRWTGRAVVPRHAGTLLLALWLAGRIGVLPEAMPVALAAIVAGNIAAARDRRNAPVALLVALFAAGGCLVRVTAPETQALGLRLGLASVIGVQAVLAGRIVPALTARHVLLRTGAAPPPYRRVPEALVALLTGAALAAWVVAPDGGMTALLAVAAAAGQAVRLASWQGWRARHAPPALVLHAAYAWLPAGLLLLAWHIARPAALGEAAAVHAWAVGGIAVTCLGIMSSMIRRHVRRPFAASASATACYASGLLAGAARLGAELEPAWRSPFLLAAILFWIGSNLMFLWAFGDVLLPRGRLLGGPDAVS